MVVRKKQKSMKSKPKHAAPLTPHHARGATTVVGVRISEDLHRQAISLGKNPPLRMRAYEVYEEAIGDWLRKHRSTDDEYSTAFGNVSPEERALLVDVLTLIRNRRKRPDLEHILALISALCAPLKESLKDLRES